jgi:glycosyltransferase involved in cell wall biosynthesis
VGRLAAEKNIELVKDVLVANPKARFAVIGDGPYRTRLEQIFQGTQTIFHGYLKGAALATAYASADVFMMPSSTETFGLVAVEANAAGLPVIGVRGGGIPDIIRDGYNGFLVTPNDPKALGEVLRKFLELSTESRLELKKQARSSSLHWDWSGTVELLINYYREAQSLASKRKRFTQEDLLVFEGKINELEILSAKTRVPAYDDTGPWPRLPNLIHDTAKIWQYSLSGIAIRGSQSR